MRLNAARQSPVSAASVPPATTTSASPRWIIRVASPIACAPVAQALATLKPGPVGAERASRPRRRPRSASSSARRAARRARSPLASHAFALALQRDQAADAGADDDADALRLDAVGQPRLLRRPGRRPRRRAGRSGRCGGPPSASSTPRDRSRRTAAGAPSASSDAPEASEERSTSSSAPCRRT